MLLCPLPCLPSPQTDRIPKQKRILFLFVPTLVWYPRYSNSSNTFLLFHGDNNNNNKKSTKEKAEVTLRESVSNERKSEQNFR